MNKKYKTMTSYLVVITALYTALMFLSQIILAMPDPMSKKNSHQMIDIPIGPGVPILFFINHIGFVAYLWLLCVVINLVLSTEISFRLLYKKTIAFWKPPFLLVASILSVNLSLLSEALISIEMDKYQVLKGSYYETSSIFLRMLILVSVFTSTIGLIIYLLALIKRNKDCKENSGGGVPPPQI